MGEAEIQEAAAAVLQSTGASSYLYGIGYSIDKFKNELDSASRHIRSQAGVAAAR